MAQDSSNEKQHVHELIDRLDPAQISAVVPLLQFMLMDPLDRSLAAAPVEQEPVSPEEAVALDQARGSPGRGEGISHEDILREFGFPRGRPARPCPGRLSSGRRKLAPISARSSAKLRCASCAPLTLTSISALLH
jgi:hypothetical protein